jgi:hypothetical protein
MLAYAGDCGLARAVPPRCLQRLDTFYLTTAKKER